jgi:Mandelate racemase / muconate lactonizing enzyme, N-terminal domain
MEMHGQSCVVVRVRTADGLTGLGEGVVPGGGPGWGGGSVESIKVTIDAYLAPAVTACARWGKGESRPGRVLARVFLVGEVTAPGGVVAGVVGLLVGELHVEAGGGGAVPVVLARLDVDAVARPHFLDRASLALDQAACPETAC